MIIEPKPKVAENDTTLDKIRKSNFAFYLGGSRRMNRISPEMFPISDSTDWDFFADDSTSIRMCIENTGFKLKKKNDYYDDEVIAIYTHPDNIQIVLRKDAVFYNNVISSIDPEFYWKYLWKSSLSFVMQQENIQMIFNQLFKMARSQDVG